MYEAFGGSERVRRPAFARSMEDVVEEKVGKGRIDVKRED